MASIYNLTLFHLPTNCYKLYQFIGGLQIYAKNAFGISNTTNQTGIKAEFVLIRNTRGVLVNKET